MPNPQEKPVEEQPVVQQEDVAPAEAKKTDGSESPPSSWDAIFDHPRFKQLIDRAKTAESQLAEEAAAKKKAEEKRLADERRFEELATQYANERDAAVKELATERFNGLKQRIAAEESLPPELATRLAGETEDELRADAKALGKLLPKADDGLPPTPKPQAGPQITSDERRKLAYRSRL